VTGQQELRSSPACAGMEARSQLLLVIDRRLLIGKSICHWLAALGPEFDPIPMASSDHALCAKVMRNEEEPTALRLKAAEVTLDRAVPKQNGSGAQSLTSRKLPGLRVANAELRTQLERS
jgi:hypothetical protein